MKHNGWIRLCAVLLCLLLAGLLAVPFSAQEEEDGDSSELETETAAELAEVQSGAESDPGSSSAADETEGQKETEAPVQEKTAGRMVSVVIVAFFAGGSLIAVLVIFLTQRKKKDPVPAESEENGSDS